MKSKIIAVSGRKFSGKSSLCNYVQAYLAARDHNDNWAGSPAGQGEGPLPYVKVTQSSAGTLNWYSYEESAYSGRSVLQPMDDEYLKFLKLDPESTDQSKVYSFADSLKEMCINLLGLTPEQVWGTEEQKNSKTRYTWDTLPEYVRWVGQGRELHNPPFDRPTGFGVEGDQMDFLTAVMNAWIPVQKSGPMTARHVMQVLGTDIMRKMFNDNIWVDSTIRKIAREEPPVALLADMRFRTEFNAVHEAGGYVIRLERAVYTEDTHSSEVDFDNFDFAAYPRTLTIPADCDIGEKNRLAVEWVEEVILKDEQCQTTSR